MNFTNCSKCGKLLKPGDNYVPFFLPINPNRRFGIYGMNNLDFCTPCAEELNIKFEENGTI